MQVLVYIEMGITVSGWSRKKWKQMVAGKSLLLLYRFNFKELRNLKKGQGSECSFHTLFTNIKYCPCKIASPRFWDLQSSVWLSKALCVCNTITWNLENYQEKCGQHVTTAVCLFHANPGSKALQYCSLKIILYSILLKCSCDSRV